MNREIKFRAWHKKNQTMMTSYQAIKTIVGHFITDNPIKDDYILMQCTGEKDREGTEIYEGDLFNIAKEPDVFDVVFMHGCYLFYKEQRMMGPLGDLKNAFIKVIGNKYENPELLEINKELRKKKKKSNFDD